MKPLAAFIIAATLAAPLAGQTRIASDFEIAEMKQQLACSRHFLAQLSARLNLGDAYLSRNEPAVAMASFAEARALAGRERLAARVDSDLTRYATATAYEALAAAKLNRGAESYALLEEAIRYASDSSKTWNLYSSAMSVLRKPAKATAAARNAVAIASQELQRSPDLSTRLDLAIYQYTLASALIESDEETEAEALLRTVLESLRSGLFAPLRRSVAESESFEIYSTARGDEAAYLSILNRSQLRLAALLEQRGDRDGAREEYKRVLQTRTDDATALAALARLGTDDQRERQYAAAFDANPFAMTLVREYQRHLARSRPAAIEGTTPGARVRRALLQLVRGETRDARETLDALITEHPDNETLKSLRRESESSSSGPTELRELLTLLTSERLTPEQRTALDSRTFVYVVTFDDARAAAENGQTVFESGSIDGLRFKFAQPTAFLGVFAAATPVRLTFRILGATDVRGADGLLIEPIALEAQ
jgi:tetratricopeptide (TPR) repeat protein